MADNDPTLSDDAIFAATWKCIEAWNSLDVEAVLDTYTDDVVYRDSGSDGPIEGKDRLRGYLTKFMATWDMRFRVLEDRRIAGSNAQVCIWDVEVRRRGTEGPVVTQMGIDIIHVRGDQLSRDEAFMDRVAMNAAFGR